MDTIYSDDHRLHRGRFEFSEGELHPCFEKPERADQIIAAVRAAGLGEVLPPDEFGPEPLLRVHDARYVDFLGEAWDLWTAAGRNGDAMPYSFPLRGMREREPEHIDGKLGFFAFDAGTPIMEGTWRAVKTSANVALTGAARLDGGERAVFAACRPPGHHAARDYGGGYCYLNNAAIAAQDLRDRGAARVAILDIDYHHGNGTQSIFYDRGDVLFVSIHGDPEQEYPYFLGHADETGTGAGAGCNFNYPLRWQSPASTWFEALNDGCRQIEGFAPDCLVVSLGLDTFIDDPISQFRLETADYLRVGRGIAALALPTLFILEGGYAVSAIGDNAVNVLAAAADVLA